LSHTSTDVREHSDIGNSEAHDESDTNTDTDNDDFKEIGTAGSNKWTHDNGESAKTKEAFGTEISRTLYAMRHRYVTKTGINTLIAGGAEMYHVREDLKSRATARGVGMGKPTSWDRHQSALVPTPKPAVNLRGQRRGRAGHRHTLQSSLRVREPESNAVIRGGRKGKLAPRHTHQSSPLVASTESKMERGGLGEAKRAPWDKSDVPLVPTPKSNMSM